MFRCPGQDMRKLTVSYHPCPKCKKPVEFFSDEMRIRCPNCKTLVHKDQAPSCLQWCRAARDCLGPELYDQIIGKLKEQDEEEQGGSNEPEKNH